MPWPFWSECVHRPAHALWGMQFQDHPTVGVIVGTLTAKQGLWVRFPPRLPLNPHFTAFEVLLRIPNLDLAFNPWSILMENA